MTADVRIAPLPEQASDLFQVPPEDFLDTLCERISTTAKVTLLVLSGAGTFYSGYSFYYIASTHPTANGLAVHALLFTGGIFASCVINSYIPWRGRAT